MPKVKVPFLCTGNSCRSQMAEGWARHLRGNQIDVYSAGIEKHDMNPQAIADNTVDAMISNCAINLSPDKAQVWRAMARVLKPGGRVAVSDLALLQPLLKPVASQTV